MIFKYSAQTNGFYVQGVHDTIPADAVDVTDAEHASLMAGQAAGKMIGADSNGYPVLQDPPPPTLDELAAINTRALQNEMDARAQALGYDNLLSACTYAMQPAGAPFQAEGLAFVSWRSQVWSEAYAVLAQVKAGQQPMPTEAECIAAMPALVLPS